MLISALATTGFGEQVAITFEAALAGEEAGGITGQVIVHPAMVGEGVPPRDVLVWLPPSYDNNPNARYPTLYMHDGQQVFDPQTSTHQIDWGVDETATDLIEQGRMEEIIVVAVYNTDDRMKEYSEEPEGHAYMRFLTSTLKPFIDQQYRTRPEREHTAVMGASMGGRISLLLVWLYPDVFSMAGCLSSALWGDVQKTIIEHPAPDHVKIYMDNGGVELDEELQPDNTWMVGHLQSRGFTIGENLVWFADPDAQHNEEAWAKRVWMPLLYMFGIGPQSWIAELPPP